MTVTQAAGVVRLPWEGFRASALPIGAWKVDNTGVGDGTGGTFNLRTDFRLTGDAPSGLAYSVEAFACQVTDTSNLNLGVRTAGFDQLMQRGLALTNGISFAASDGSKLALPWFLGQLQVPNSGGASMSTNMQNTDLKTYTMSAMGYIWSARSIRAEGGYQRPTTSPWG